MLKKYLPLLVSIFFYAVAITVINLLLIFIYVAANGIMSGAEIFDAHFYLTTVANLLFLEGVLVFVIGTFLEFMVKARSPSIARIMMLPYEVLSRRFPPEEKDLNAAGIEEHGSGGWMPIFIGALVIIFSAVFAIISLK
jgi:hypothetical protein